MHITCVVWVCKFLGDHVLSQFDKLLKCKAKRWQSVAIQQNKFQTLSVDRGLTPWRTAWQRSGSIVFFFNSPSYNVPPYTSHPKLTEKTEHSPFSVSAWYNTFFNHICDAYHKKGEARQSFTPPSGVASI